MHPLWWTILGLVMGVLAMLPVLRGLLRRGEHRAREAERQARDAARLAELGSMTGGLAHEIKNPLSTVGLNAQLLAEGIEESQLPADQRDRLLKRLGSLRREVDRLRNILTDFLEFAGRIRLAPEQLDVRGLLTEIDDFFHPQCEQSGVVLRIQCPESVVEAQVDEGLLKQAILNLMINAVQAMTRSASPDHEVAGELMLRLEPSEDAIDIHVIDTGPGIDPERLEEIFRPYVSGRPSGTGLGLAIARRIVDEHGGRLSATSEVGQGSDFVIHLPRRQTTDPK